MYPKPFLADLNNCTNALIISTHYGLFKNCTLSLTLCHSHDDDEDYNHSTVPQKYYTNALVCAFTYDECHLLLSLIFFLYFVQFCLTSLQIVNVDIRVLLFKEQKLLRTISAYNFACL